MTTDKDVSSEFVLCDKCGLKRTREAAALYTCLHPLNMQYYTATFYGKLQLGWLDDHFFCFIGHSSQLVRKHVNLIPDLTPVKFVPQDAVVIEGVTPEGLIFFLRQMEPASTCRNGARDTLLYCKKSLLAKLTPPKPRPVEPETYGSVIKASKPNSSKKYILTKDLDGHWQASDEDLFLFSDLFDIEILFVAPEAGE